MADEADGVDGNYRWETGYERTWEAIREDESGSLQASIDDLQRAKRQLHASRAPNLRIGMMRHMVVIVDMSEAMTDQDLKPNRFTATLKLLEGFLDTFFDQNPISQLGILVTKNKRAEKLTDLSGNTRRHLTALQGLQGAVCTGEPSLQNALEMALQLLRHMPSYTSREILIVMGSLTTCDPGNISSTVKSLKAANCRCSVIGLAADIRVCRKLSEETGGTYHVMLDESHFKEILSSHAIPPAAPANAGSSSESSLVKMGFPTQCNAAGKDRLSVCICHQDERNGTSQEAKDAAFTDRGHICPQCQAKYCELPVECSICGLTLVSAPHLARSYHHLFPLQAFEEVPKCAGRSESCAACLVSLESCPVYRCKDCRSEFCIDCDVFIHEMLHSCPACSSVRGSMTGSLAALPAPQAMAYR